jgi:CHAD domain-containing protein/CYTH domain-containing protein
MAPLPDDLLDLPADRGARLVLRGLLDRARAARKRLGRAEDAEALHDFRVALRRLRSWERAYRSYLGKTVPKRLRTALRGLARATSAGRDAEVQLAWLRQAGGEVVGAERASGVAWLTGRLEERRDHAYGAMAEVGRAFDALERTWRARLRRRGPAAAERFGPVAAGLVEQRMEELRQRLADVRGADDAPQIHAARIRGKRLRYLLEPLEPYGESVTALLERLRRLQDLLGELHDLHGVGAELARARVSPAGQRDLEPLRERAHRAVGERFTGLRDQWLDGADGFFTQVEGFARSLLPAGHAAREIEHKYLLSGLPADIAQFPAVEIQQGWLPGETLQERLRAVCGPDGVRYYRCVKLGTGLERLELEEETPKELFEVLWPLTEGRRIVKRRHARPVGRLTWEIDAFLDRDLVLAEVEVPFARRRVLLPAWLKPLVVREVTGEAAYLNVNLAR